MFQALSIIIQASIIPLLSGQGLHKEIHEGMLFLSSLDLGGLTDYPKPKTKTQKQKTKIIKPKTQNHKPKPKN